MIDLKYSEILKLNKQLGLALQEEQFKVTVLANIITHQLNEIFEYTLRTENINAVVRSGDYDNIVQDAAKFNDSDLIIIFWEAANLIDGLQYKANLMDDAAIELFVSKTCTEIDFALASLQSTSQIVFNKFSSIVFTNNNIKKNKFDIICNKLNAFLEKKQQRNLLLIDIENIIASVSVQKSVDFRFYYSSKALYTIEFYKKYVSHIKNVIFSSKGKSKKALIFDCDNTLWKGILGEDGFDKIEMSGKSKNGVLFEEIQSMAVDLSKKGILIGLCSKNNAEDVENVINHHTDMIIRNEHISIKKINWDDKVSNLKTIAKELNIGLDSLVFIDDSDFELGFIKSLLPEVTLIKVPTNLYEYPSLVRENLSLFYSNSESAEDAKRTELYKQEVLRADEQKTFDNIENYLQSLQLAITIFLNPTNLIPRLSQLTQKTNQFNLTTKRYSEADISKFMNSNDFINVAFEVADKYGDAGVVGICILALNKENKTASIDSFLMSCRVIGRNIETAFLNFLLKYLEDIGIEIVEAQYIRTLKNSQVGDFYNKHGFECVHDSENEKRFKLKLADYKENKITYIKINDGREN